jgi:Tol biopolymer transport system component
MTRGFERRDVGDIWTVDLATGDTTHVTSSPKTYDHQVAWFADGNRLVLERVRWDHAQIVSVRPSGAGVRVLTSGYFDANPAPSPSGTAIAFVSDRLGSFLPDLWTMEPDGSNPQAIADLMFASTTPDWQAIAAG